MPIYAYRCESCAHEQEVLQKLSDPPLMRCPQCQCDTLRKQLTAAGFQLKGSGWYVTDFRDSNKKNPSSSEKAVSKEGETAAAVPQQKTSFPEKANPSSTSTTSSKP